MVIVHSVYAEEIFCANTEAPTVETVVVFANGVLVETEYKADRAVRAIKKKLKIIYSPEEMATMEFKVAYNKSHGLLDFFEAVLQKGLSENSIVSFWRLVGNFDPMPNWAQDKIKNMAASLDIGELVGGVSLSKHLKLYRNSIREGKKVLVVAHSQGNFFANEAYDLLYYGNSPIEQQSFGIVSVANPSGFVGGSIDGAYTTLEEDKVIASIRLVLTGLPLAEKPLPANIGNGEFVTMEPLGHFFLDSYLVSGSNSESKIINDIITGISSLQQPFTVTEDEIITITASWNNPFGTQQMLITEPFTYTVVSENYPNGSYGNFTSTNSGGITTQRYFVSCETLAVGGYLAQVYDFEHDPNPVSVQIKAGSVTRNYEVSFVLSDGVPVYLLPIAKVYVSANGESGFNFQILNIINTTNESFSFSEF